MEAPDLSLLVLTLHRGGHLVNENVECSLYARTGRKVKNTRLGVQPFFSKNQKQKSNRVITSERLIELVSSLVELKKRKVMERKIFYDEIYEDIIRSIQTFEDDDISERYACLYDYFLDHEDIISQYKTFNFSHERYFDKIALDRVAKRILPNDCHALFPVFTKRDDNYLFNSISLLHTGEQSQLSTELRIKVVCEMVKNTHNRY